jgi:hypothetical protein
MMTIVDVEDREGTMMTEMIVVDVGVDLGTIGTTIRGKVRPARIEIVESIGGEDHPRRMRTRTALPLLNSHMSNL